MRTGEVNEVVLHINRDLPRSIIVEQVPQSICCGSG
jgi:hypothetical protein